MIAQHKRWLQAALLLLVSICVGCASESLVSSSSSLSSPPMLYKGGLILTMEGEVPRYEDVMVEQRGKIAFLGTLAEAERLYPTANVYELDGKTLLPGFIDPHSHFSMVINAVGQANVSSPPVGPVQNFADLINELNNYKKQFNIQKDEWIFAWGYDETQLEEMRHISKTELDIAFPNNPVYLQHTSGHLGIANSYALKLANIDNTTPDPEGGKIIRFPNSQEPTGQVQEVAIYFFAGKAIQEFIPKKAALFARAQDYYLKNGVTTAQDGMTDPLNMKFFKQVAKAGELTMDLVTVHGMDSMLTNDLTFGVYQNGLKPQGIKLIADGSPQGKTAYFTKKYLTKVDGCEANCVGYPHMSQGNLDALMLRGYKNGFQMFIHGNGDAAIDMIIEAHEKACATLGEPMDMDRRTVVIHSQFVRPEQLEAFKRYNIMPSFFTNHAYFFGDVHVENLGPQRAHFLSPLNAASEMGLVYTNHSDETVTPIDPIFGVHTAVNRLTRSGQVLGKEQRVSPYFALKAVTINAAHQIFDENTKGSLSEGKLADFVILDKNPIDVNPSNIKDINVVATIKNGKEVFSK